MRAKNAIPLIACTVGSHASAPRNDQEQKHGGLAIVKTGVVPTTLTFNQWFGEFISQSRHELDLAPPEPPYQAGEIYDLLNQGESLFRVGGLRVLRVGDDSYVNGEKIVTPHRAAAAALAARYDISREQLGDALKDPSFLALLAGLINSGYWYFKN